MKAKFYCVTSSTTNTTYYYYYYYSLVERLSDTQRFLHQAKGIEGLPHKAGPLVVVVVVKVVTGE